MQSVYMIFLFYAILS